MKYKIAVIVMIVGVWVCSASSAENLVAPLKERTTDEQITMDKKTFNALQERLALLNQSGIPVASYPFVKAQTWLDFAFDEYTDNDKTGMVEQALHEAVYHIHLMEDKALLTTTATPIGSGSKKIRPDLWDHVAKLKQEAGFACGGAKVAKLEVMLVWAGHEEKELGFRHATPYIEQAEQLDKEVSQIISSASCVDAETSPHPSVVNGFSTMPKEDVARLVSLADQVHFALNEDSISRKTAAVIHQIALVLQKYPSMKVSLHGYADMRGTSKYNMALSRRRAEAVQRYLTAAGVSAKRITVVAHGKTSPTAMTKNNEGYAKNRRVEFIFEQGGKIQPIKQEGDLQLERARRKRRGR